VVILDNRIPIVILMSLVFLLSFGAAYASQETYRWTRQNQQVSILTDGTTVYWTMSVTPAIIFTQCRLAPLTVEITNLKTSTASLEWETIAVSLTGDVGSGTVSFTFGTDLDDKFPIPVGQSRVVDVGIFEFSEGVPLGTFQGTIEMTVNNGAPEELSNDFQVILQATCAPVGGTVYDPPYNVQLIPSTAAEIIIIATAAIVVLCREKWPRNAKTDPDR
jgi:hypothetical protein